MLFYFSLFIFSNIILTKQACVQGQNLCSKCNPITKLCVKCEKDIYSPDANGGCEYSKKCVFGNNHCLECLNDGKTCKECDVGYFPDEYGGCSITDNCEVSYKGECLKCKDNYVLIGRNNYYSSINDFIKLCKPMNSDDLQHCNSINYEKGVCLGCEDGYYYSSSDKKCTKIQNCASSSFGVCKRCNYGYYLNNKQQKCMPQSDLFINCKISNDGQKCDECNDDYYFDKEGKCVYSNYCAEGETYKCDKCIDNYYLTSYGGICTTEENCYSGRKDIGICTQCNDNYCIDFKDGKCKSNQEDNDLKDCKVADGKCQECKYGKYLGQDKKCCNTPNCAKSENGICNQCINNYYLGLDKKCSSVEHCIYSDNYLNCIECEGNYYYNKRNGTCLIGEGKFVNCKYGYSDQYCEKCKNDFYINKRDNLCYSNKEPGNYYKCEVSNGEVCTQCIEEYYLSRIDKRCTKAQFCDVIENENRCLLCSDTYCLDAKSGFCEDNDIINDVEKLFYFRCNKTNSEATACEFCLEGYELKDGLCFDDQHCVERNDDGTCKKCQKLWDEYYEQCLSTVFGCIEGYYDENCLECNDLSDVGECTGCMKGYEFDMYHNCVEIEEESN